jgi:phosphoribosylamine--glycine ligase
VVTTKVAEMALWWVCEPIIKALARDGKPFKGVLYAGLMIDQRGDPKVLEFNVRFGDPECQPLMLRLESDLAEILMACAQGTLDQVEVKWSPQPSVCVVLAAEGYPEAYQKGRPIGGLDQAGRVPGVEVFHAGTAEKDGQVVTAGGRVLGVSARADSLAGAVQAAYRAADQISWEGKYLRRDIAHRAMAREAAGSPGIYPGGAVTGPAAEERRRQEEAARAQAQRRAARSPLVGVLMGSANDAKAMAGATETLAQLGIPYEARVISAHRTPAEAAEFASGAAARGIKVIIAGAGWAAHLAGAMAAHTTLPVIGVPIDSSALSGMDALLSTVQMPPGIPVATVSIGKGGAKNAAILAAQMIALSDEGLAGRLEEMRRDMAAGVRQADQDLDL